MEQYSLGRKALAWSVHLFTATGVLFAFLAILAVEQEDFVLAMWWLIVTLIIDGVDGTFARKLEVKKVIPHFDGNSIDHVIDFLTYAIIPAYFIYKSDILPLHEGWKLAGIAAILLSSTYYYGKTTYVTEDLHFEGFPVMWNAVAFFLYFLFGHYPWASLIIIFVIAVLHFLPWKYPYPSQTREFKKWNLLASFLIFIIGMLTLFLYPAVPLWLKIAAYVVMGYFWAMTIFKTFFYKA